MAGSGTTGDVIESVSCFEDRKCRMYDIEPSDDRIKRSNILQTGIPEETGSVDYVFLDPPHDFYPRGLEPGYSAAAAQSDTMRKLKAILRESVRIIKPGGYNVRSGSHHFFFSRRSGIGQTSVLF